MGMFKSPSRARQPEKPAEALLPFNVAPVQAVIDVVIPQFHRTSSTVHTLSELGGWLEDHATEDSIATLPDETAPVTSAQVEELIEQFEAARQEEKDSLPGIDARALRALRQARALVALVEEKQAARHLVPITPVTRAEFDAIVDALGWALGAFAEELNRGQPSKSHVIDLMHRSASSPERMKLFGGICKFKEADVPRRTQAEWLNFQTHGKF